MELRNERGGIKCFAKVVDCAMVVLAGGEQ